MSLYKIGSAERQVYYVGNSVGLAALRRSLEARGVVSRSRLTPIVTAVVADAGTPPDHPALVTARELGIDILSPVQARDTLLTTPGQRLRAMPAPATSTPLIIVTVLVLIGAIALLGFLGALPVVSSHGQTTTVEPANDHP